MTVNSLNSVQMTPVYAGGEAAPAAQTQAPVAAPVAQSAPSPVSVSAPSGGSAASASDPDFEKIMEEPIRQANKALHKFDRQIEREIHDVTKALMYTIRDTRTNEVIAEYPPKKIQDMIAKMWELAGLFIDQKA